MVNIKCGWEWTDPSSPCEEEADPDITGLVPWGDFCFCPKHDKAMMDQYIAYQDMHPEPYPDREDEDLDF
jgi:hypothetical protein